MIRSDTRLALSITALVLGLAASPAVAQSVIYTYDALGRLTSATYPGGMVVHYAYDAAGNRTQVMASSTPPPAPLSASVDQMIYTRTGSSVPQPVACQGNGGTAPYSYWWQFVSGDTLTETTTDGATAATGWVRPVASSTFRNSTWRCRVTDASSTTADSPDVAVSIRTN